MSEVNYYNIDARRGKYGSGYSRDEVLAWMQKTCLEDDGKRIVVYEHFTPEGIWCVTSLKGAMFKGKKCAEPIEPELHFILMLNKHNKWWRTAHISEDDEEIMDYVTATKASLKMTKTSPFKNDEWREKVLQWHSDKKTERFRWKKLKDNIKEGDPIFLKEGLKPERGTFAGFRYDSNSYKKRDPRYLLMEADKDGELKNFKISMKNIDIDKTVVRVLLS